MAEKKKLEEPDPYLEFDEFVKRQFNGDFFKEQFSKFVDDKRARRKQKSSGWRALWNEFIRTIVPKGRR